MQWGIDRFSQVEWVPVSEWKGQLPKKETELRMTKKYHTTFETDDECDAVGIGDYYQEEILKWPKN